MPPMRPSRRGSWAASSRAWSEASRPGFTRAGAALAPPPPRDFARLGGNEAAFGQVVEDDYRYYQFYGNMLVALSIAFAARHTAAGAGWMQLDGIDALLIALMGVFFAGSRDTLRKYYDRTAQLLRVEHGGHRAQPPSQNASSHQPRGRHAEGSRELIDVDQ
jgi:hypothetical protein